MSSRLPLGLSLALARTSIRPQLKPLQLFLLSARRPITSVSPINLLTRRAFTTNPSTSPIPKSSWSQLFRRALSTTNRASLRQTYFPKQVNGGGRGPGGRRGFRWFLYYLDSYPPMVYIYAIIGLNVAIFCLWQYAYQSWTQFRDPGLYHWMMRNFVTSEMNIQAGRVWTLLTSCFSHSSANHLFFNCLGLYFVAPAAAGLIGGSAFLGLYLVGGIASSVASLLWHRARGEKSPGSNGASGAIYTTLAFYGALFPTSTILLFFIIPMPVWAAISGFFAYDLWQSVYRPNSGTDGAGHMGGMIAGLLAAYRVRRGGVGSLFRFRRR